MNIILMAAITADGKIAKNSNHLADWTSKADKKIFVEETKKARVIIMGRTTYETIGRPLPGRLNLVLTSSPEKYQNQNGVLEYINANPKETIEYLESKGLKNAVICGGAKTYGDFLKAGIVNEIFLTVEPKIFGTGISLFDGADLNVDLNLISSEVIGENSVFIKYKVI